MTLKNGKYALINGIKVYGNNSISDFRQSIIDNKTKSILIAVNAEKIVKSTANFKDLINTNIGYPDGMGAVRALRKKGINAVKIPGCELWLDIISNHPEKKYYFIGGTELVITKTIEKLKSQYSRIQIAGCRNGFLRDSREEFDLIKNIKHTSPDVVFVAMGSPRQELLMQKLISEHPALYQGLGGSFDVYCGHLKRAPKIYQEIGLEWFYRLLMQPRRIKRYFLPLAQFFFKLHFGRL